MQFVCISTIHTMTYCTRIYMYTLYTSIAVHSVQLYICKHTKDKLYSFSNFLDLNFLYSLRDIGQSFIIKNLWVHCCWPIFRCKYWLNLAIFLQSENKYLFFFFILKCLFPIVKTSGDTPLITIYKTDLLIKYLDILCYILSASLDRSQEPGWKKE